LLSLHGVDPERLGLTLSLATTIRLFSAPLAGRIADRHHALRIINYDPKRRTWAAGAITGVLRRSFLGPHWLPNRGPDDRGESRNSKCKFADDHDQIVPAPFFGRPRAPCCRLPNYY
jgi:hypothetical protein